MTMEPTMHISGPDNEECRRWGMFLATSAIPPEDGGVSWGGKPVLYAETPDSFNLAYVVEVDVATELGAIADALADPFCPPPPPFFATAERWAIIVEGEGAILQRDDPAVLDPEHLADLKTMRMLFATTGTPGEFIAAAVEQGSDKVRVTLNHEPPPGWFQIAEVLPALERVAAAARQYRPGVN